MKIEENNGKMSIDTLPNPENDKGIENHKKAATHFEAAARKHHQAAKHHELGNHKKAAKCTIKAHGHSCLANEAQKQDVKHHIIKIED